MAKTPAALKRLIVGRPMSSGELQHTLLPKAIALPVFASDALSSMAYATQEMLLVLSLVGTAALSFVVPLSVAVSVLLAIVIVSYRQIVRAYPGGGGAYIVAYENLGLPAGLAVAAALLLDYVLTVAVSITAGADAIVSAVPELDDNKVILTIALIGLVSLANLRGSKESGRIFAVPTYGFVVSIYILIFTGLVKCLGGCPQAESAGEHLESQEMLGAFILLKAFAAGTTALTGVEAIAEGVPVFRFPQSRNAAATLGILGALSISMFVGMSWLTDHTNVVYTEEATRTTLAQVAHAVFGGGPMFYVVQTLTALILILAANTAYTGFPVLASILAGDRMLPRQFRNRGDRLVFSNGIIILAISASALVWLFEANLNALIQLYLVGVFLSFTLAQFGTVVRWRRTREPGWQKSAAINLFGATVTGIVLVVVVLTKFVSGAWIVITATPVVMLTMKAIRTHYTRVADELADETRVPVDRRPGNQNLVLFINKVDAAAARSVGYARSVRPNSVRAVTPDPSLQPIWKRLAPEIPIQTLPKDRSIAKVLINHLAEIREGLGRDDFLTVVVPEVLKSRSLVEILKHPSLHRLKAALVAEGDIQVMDVPVLREETDPSIDQAHEPARNHVCVLVSGLHNASLQAIEFAETLRPTTVRAISFGLEPEATEKLGNDWLAQRVPIPLEIQDSPFRDIGASLVQYIRDFEADGLNRVVTIVIPEFIVTKWYHHFLHGKNALVLKRHLLFEPGVVTVSVPYHLGDEGDKGTGPLEGGPVIS
jgi:amino acid transporter